MLDQRRAAGERPEPLPRRQESPKVGSRAAMGDLGAANGPSIHKRHRGMFRPVKATGLSGGSMSQLQLLRPRPHLSAESGHAGEITRSCAAGDAGRPRGRGPRLLPGFNRLGIRRGELPKSYFAILAKRGGCWFEQGSLKLHLGVGGRTSGRRARRIRSLIVEDPHASADAHGRSIFPRPWLMRVRERRAACEGYTRVCCGRPLRQPDRADRNPNAPSKTNRRPQCSTAGAPMLFMVIEHFKNKDPKPIGERFKREGRMMPEGVAYHASWIDPAAARCFQVMEADSVEKLRQWAANWADLADFEIVPVLTSQAYLGGPITVKDRAHEKTGPAKPDRSSLELTLASLDRAGFALPRQRAVLSCKTALVPVSIGASHEGRRPSPPIAASSQIAAAHSMGVQTIWRRRGKSATASLRRLSALREVHGDAAHVEALGCDGDRLLAARQSDVHRRREVGALDRQHEAAAGVAARHVAGGRVGLLLPVAGDLRSLTRSSAVPLML